MERVPAIAEPKHVPAPARYVSTMHGEPTQVDVYTRIPDAMIRTIRMAQMELVVMRCGTVSISRQATQAVPRARRFSTFILQVAGRSAFRHYGHSIELEAGDFTFCDNSAQYELALEGVNEVIMFRVPNGRVNEVLPSANYLCGLRLRRDEGFASTAAAMAIDLARKDFDQIPPALGERAGRLLLDMLSTSFCSLTPQSKDVSAIMASHFWKVKLFIEDNLRDPQLSPSMVARGMHLSDRYLRLIFSSSEESPAAYIMRRRLEECAAQLRDPRWRSHSITDIAFSWGFNSAPHFTRSFRSRFLCSPRDYRQDGIRQLPSVH